MVDAESTTLSFIYADLQGNRHPENHPFLRLTFSFRAYNPIRTFDKGQLLIVYTIFQVDKLDCLYKLSSKT